MQTLIHLCRQIDVVISERRDLTRRRPLGSADDRGAHGGGTPIDRQRSPAIDPRRSRPGGVDQPVPGGCRGSEEFETSFGVTGPERRLPPAVELTVFRIAQEALSNVERHAGAVTSPSASLRRRRPAPAGQRRRSRVRHRRFRRSGAPLAGAPGHDGTSPSHRFSPAHPLGTGRRDHRGSMGPGNDSRPEMTDAAKSSVLSMTRRITSIAIGPIHPIRTLNCHRTDMKSRVLSPIYGILVVEQIVIESCHSTWIIDMDHSRFRRLVKGSDHLQPCLNGVAGLLRRRDRPAVRVLCRAS